MKGTPDSTSSRLLRHVPYLEASPLKVQCKLLGFSGLVSWAVLLVDCVAFNSYILSPAVPVAVRLSLEVISRLAFHPLVVLPRFRRFVSESGITHWIRAPAAGF